MLNQKINQLSNFLIRPKRRSYQLSQLGPYSFKTKHGCCIRHDFDVRFTYGKSYVQEEGCQWRRSAEQWCYTQEEMFSPRSPSCPLPSSSTSAKTITLKASIFIPTQASKNYNFSKNLNNQVNSNENICLLAMHGNTGSRISTLSMLEPALKCGLTFANFDFGGCGNSEGQFVTLGYYEKYQIAAVLQQIQNKFGYHKFILSGRSMGAASSLFYSCLLYPIYTQNKQKSIQKYLHNHQHQHLHTGIQILSKLNTGYFGYEIIGIILDSPYSNTKEMFMDLVGRKLWFCPNIAIDYLLGVVEKRAQERLVVAGIGNILRDDDIVEYKDYEDENDKKNIKMNIIIKNQTKPKQSFPKKQKPLSICNDIEIPFNPLIPFPVYIIYGIEDDVISKKHTLNIFNALQCKNKKLQILQNAGHGSHREDQVKVSAICWVLEWEAQGNIGKIQEDARILGLTVEEYIQLWGQNGGNREYRDSEDVRFQKMEYMYRDKIRQKVSQGEIQTEKTCSMTSLKIQTSTSIKSKSYNYQPSQKSKNYPRQQVNNVKEQQQLRISIVKQLPQKQTYLNIDLFKKSRLSVYTNLKNQLDYRFL